MQNTNEIRERMEVVDAGGYHVGFVEAVEGDTIRLMRADPDPNAPHRRFPVAWVEHVGQTVRLDRDRDQVVRDGDVTTR